MLSNKSSILEVISYGDSLSSHQIDDKHLGWLVPGGYPEPAVRITINGDVSMHVVAFIYVDTQNGSVNDVCAIYSSHERTCLIIVSMSDVGDNLLELENLIGS